MLKILLCVAVFVSSFVIGIYFYNFHSHLSKSTQDWANFGTYVGGILGPFYALLAFVGLLETIRQSKLQRELEGLLLTITNLEKDFNYWASLAVTCDSPLIWGNKNNVSSDIKEVPLRTLLEGDSIDWEPYLKNLRESLSFRFQKNGVLYQDRDIWLKAKLTISSLFACLEIYKYKCGEEDIYKYYYEAYEIAKNRPQDSDWKSIDEI
ncbi:hypothetical protein FLM55_01595 [Francisella sp. Scap27]|uniref:hypothetical protein n=1 Tax=Francisella sp. Scap27 TaxID=2589986 RepID=UPI0015BA94E3|nr:hypothetical protein [Francisella sp. Scap27]QLE78505.1 hypothetical protein FLM55_01595 [Francisella sp. Scap27]